MWKKFISMLLILCFGLTYITTGFADDVLSNQKVSYFLDEANNEIKCIKNEETHTVYESLGNYIYAYSETGENIFFLETGTIKKIDKKNDYCVSLNIKHDVLDFSILNDNSLVYVTDRDMGDVNEEGSRIFESDIYLFNFVTNEDVLVAKNIIDYMVFKGCLYYLDNCNNLYKFDNFGVQLDKGEYEQIVEYFNYNEQVTLFASSPDDIVAIANKEIGYKESGNNVTKYGSWYGMQGAWCAMFVSWCANQAGVSTDVIPKFANCDVGKKWFNDRGLYKTSSYYGGGTYSPQKGDIIFFGKPSDSTHVGIVTGSDSGKVYTVEGNTSNSVRARSYSLNSDYVIGYGMPRYSSKTDKENPVITNVRFENIDASGFNVLCTVSDNVGIEKVLFPTWTTSDQSDIIWEECEFDGTTANCRINASAYGWKNGRYFIHIYAYDTSGNVGCIATEGLIWPDSENPKISNVEISDVSSAGYTITCNVSDTNGISHIRGATWNDEIGREPPYGSNPAGKTVWFDGDIRGETATIRVNTSEYGGRTGPYTTHLWAWDKGGNATAYGVNVFADDYKYCLDYINFENNELYMQGWALYRTSNTDIEVRYQIDSMPEVQMNRYRDDVVHQTYSQYPAGNERFNATVYGKDLSNGEHEVVIKAYINGVCVNELGRKKFTSNSDHIPKKTIIKNNHIYSIFDVNMDWVEAGKLAENKGGYLVTITSKQEQDIVEKLLEYGTSAQYWIGAMNESENGKTDVWNWITAEQFDYSNWHTGEPNNTNGNEFYAGIYSNGTWNDFPNNQSNVGYIMETEIVGVPTAYIENDGHYYYLYDNEVDWHGAKAFCEAMGGHLVTINSGAEQELIYNLAKKGNSETSGYFIGASSDEDGKVWSWVTGEDFDYTNWHSGEPNNTDGIEHYAEFYKTGLWNDRQSYNNGAKNGFICEIETDETYTVKTEYDGNTYLRIDKSLSWEDAKAYCESIGGHLATIADDEEQEAIEDLFVRGIDTLRSSYSIGGTDSDSEGDWKWITGEEFNYENWDIGEPNNGNGAESQNYMSMYSSGNKVGMWDDICNFSQNPYDIGFICEIEKKEIEPTPTPPSVDIPDPDISTPKPEKPDSTPDIDESLSTVTVGTVNAKGGETIKVPVSISNNQGICESKFVIKYDNTRLNPIKVDTGEKFTDGSIQSDIENVTENKNTLTVTWENSSIADNFNNGVMFDIEFSVVENAAPGMIPITIDTEQLEVINSNGEDISINLIDGGAAIDWPIISLANVKTQPGKIVTLPVKIENNTGINAFGFTIEYDNRALTPTEITAGEVIDGKGSMQSNLDDTSIDWENQSEVTASWLSDDLENNISDDGILFNIKFNVKSSSTIGFYPVKIKYVDGDITNSNGAEIGVTTTSGGAAVEEISVLYGDVNCDGKVNIIDIVLLRKYYADMPVEITEDGLTASDVNCDNEINNKDILLMRKYVAKWQGIVLGR